MIRSFFMGGAGLQRRIVLLCLVGSVALYVGPDLVGMTASRKLVPAGASMVQVLGTEGPFEAVVGAPGVFVLGERTSRIHAGGAVGWRQKTRVVFGTAIDASFFIKCAGMIESFADAHLLPSARHDEEWHDYGITVPGDVRGRCQVFRRSVDYAPDGRTEQRAPEPFEIEVIGP